MELLIKTSKPGRWYSLVAQAGIWRDSRKELPADFMGEFRIKDNKVSVYQLTPSRAENIARITAAITSRSQAGLVTTDCLVFDDRVVTELGIQVVKSPGKTPDRVANDWHFDLSDLSAEQLVRLASALVDTAKLEIVDGLELVDAVKRSAAAGEFDIASVGPSVRKQAGLES